MVVDDALRVTGRARGVVERDGLPLVGGRRPFGVRVEGLTAAATTSRQLSLGEPERGWREAEAATDAIAARFGRASVGPASLLGRTDLRRTENHPQRTVVPLSEPPTPS